MFKFNFLEDKPNKNVNNGSTEHQHDSTCLESRQILPNTDFTKEILATDCITVLKCTNNIHLKHVASKVTDLLGDKLKDSEFLLVAQRDLDLLTGVYEGGLKVWECTYDLVNFMVACEHGFDFQNTKVLDLGCGSGLLGLLAYINGSHNVFFQDYNEEIINYLTIPNVYLNSTDHSRVADYCKFYSGDWESFVKVTEELFPRDDDKFDYIFTSETIYNSKNYVKLHTVFKKRLKINGVVYLGAKTHYFGVGGGLREFEDFMAKENIFKFSTCWKCSDGLQREILKITFKENT